MDTQIREEDQVRVMFDDGTLNRYRAGDEGIVLKANYVGVVVLLRNGNTVVFGHHELERCR